MPKAEQTVLEIDLKALESNYKYLKSKLQPGTKFLAVVKAFAYGSDAVIVAQHLQKLGADYLAVAYVNEGVALRDAGLTIPILVLHPQTINFETLIERCLEPSLYSFRTLNKFIEVAESQNQSNYPIHIKFNTGLNRLGFKEGDLKNISTELFKTSAIQIKSIFSHLAASEDASENEFTENQIQIFESISEKFMTIFSYKPMRHLCNTSGVINYPNSHLDMVRCGIGLYGFGNSIEEDKNLKPIASLKTNISQIHVIKPMESVGYNRAYINETSQNQHIATLPIGHADGIGRQYGKGESFVLVHEKPAKIIGNVCMDMIMIDITGFDCQEGDEVIVFGPNLSASQFAKTGNTISYEIITAISQRIKRIII